MQLSETVAKHQKASPAAQTQTSNTPGSDSTETEKNIPVLSIAREGKDTVVSSTTANTKVQPDTPAVELKNTKAKECHLFFEVSVQASCKGENDGSIQVEMQSISGGTIPYHFKLSESGELSSLGVFSALGKGTYHLIGYDSKGCSQSKEILVYDKNCSQKKSYSFNPEYGESWKIPSAEGKSGAFTIFNRAGVAIFKGSFTGSDAAEWFGTNTQGSPAEVGLYVCVIDYAGGKTEVIEISIVR